MRNRAKCALCHDIIESFTREDYVECKCGAIAISGGQYALNVFAKDFSCVRRIDDLGNEIIPKVQDKDKPEDIESPKPNYKDLLEMLDAMIKSYEDLPQGALSAPASNCDLLSVLLLCSSLFRAER